MIVASSITGTNQALLCNSKAFLAQRVNSLGSGLSSSQLHMPSLIVHSAPFTTSSERIPYYYLPWWLCTLHPSRHHWGAYGITICPDDCALCTLHHIFRAHTVLLSAPTIVHSSPFTTSSGHIQYYCLPQQLCTLHPSPHHWGAYSITVCFWVYSIPGTYTNFMCHQLKAQGHWLMIDQWLLQ